MTEPIWITEQDVVELIDLPAAIDVLERGLSLEAQGKATNMVKTHVAWDKNTLHAIGAAYPSQGFIGTKTWAHTEGGACPLLILFDAQTGQLRAVVEAFALGQMRTGGISGVATKWLAAESADVLALIGTGRQALAQVAAVVAVRPIRQIRVFSPRQASRQAFIEKARSQVTVNLIEAESVGEAVRGASIVTTVTRATSAFLRAGDLDAGAHINAVGAITGEREELAPDIFDDCGTAVVDDISAAERLSTEFRKAFGNRGGWAGVSTLSAVIGTRARPSSGFTVFKAMGMGISDLALGMDIYHRAVERGLGRPIPRPERCAPELFAD